VNSDYLKIYTRKSRRKEYRQKPISVASQEKKSQIETLATNSAIPGLLLSGKLPQQAYEKI
jgi:hypothetical protein